MAGTGLVADIGGTHARFALVDADAEGVTLREPEVLPTHQFASVVDAVRHYLEGRGAKPMAAALAVAGPVENGRIALTNAGWSFSEREFGAALGIAQVRLINDFEAIAFAAPHFGAADLVDIGSARAPHGGRAAETVAIVGPGTGLGVGGYVKTRRGIVTLASEGGHAGFAPSDDVEIAILKILARRHGRVSNERLLSGPGLVAIHDALAEIEGRAPVKVEAEDVTAQALADPASLGGQAFARFCAILGAACGDIALILGARDGVLLAGGILPRMANALAKSNFRARFEAKGRFEDYLKAIPTRLVVQDYSGLLGAGWALKDRMTQA
jgi:glucokinase